MRFHDPQILWLLALLPLLAVLFVRFNRAARRTMEALAPGPLRHKLVTGERPRRRAIKQALFLAALALTVTALARPQFGVQPQEVKQVGVDIMIALDTSLSMAAEDVAPNRLERAKKEIEKLSRVFEGNRLGLLLFAGDSAVECPLTLDVSAFRLFLDSVTFNSVATGGTDLAGAIRMAADSFTDSNAKTKVVLVISDGEDHQGEPEQAAEEAAAKGVRIYTVGVGSEKGAPIPLRNTQGAITGYKKDNSGDTVITSLKPGQLRQAAKAAGGTFVASNEGGLDLEPVVKSIQGLEKSDISSMEFTSYKDRFHWFLSAALALLFIEFLI